MSKYFVFSAAAARPAIAYIGHVDLDAGLGYWEVHAWADNRQLISSGLRGPVGPVLRACPSRIVYAKISPKDVAKGFQFQYENLNFVWTPTDTDRFECAGFYPKQWSHGFGYFTEALVSPPIATSDLAYAYYGHKYASQGGVWSASLAPCGISTYLFEPASQNVLRYGLMEAGDGSGLRMGEQIGINWSKHSNLWMLTYGGHDFNGDGRVDTGDGGHACTCILAKRNGIFDRAVYIENSYQSDPTAGNIVEAAYLEGLYLPPGYLE